MRVTAPLLLLVPGLLGGCAATSNTVETAWPAAPAPSPWAPPRQAW